MKTRFLAILFPSIMTEPAADGRLRIKLVTPARLIRRRFYLLYEVQKYMPIRIWRRNNPADAQRYKRYAFQLAGPLLTG